MGPEMRSEEGEDEAAAESSGDGAARNKFPTRRMHKKNLRRNLRSPKVKRQQHELEASCWLQICDFTPMIISSSSTISIIIIIMIVPLIAASAAATASSATTTTTTTTTTLPTLMNQTRQKQNVIEQTQQQQRRPRRRDDFEREFRKAPSDDQLAKMIINDLNQTILPSFLSSSSNNNNNNNNYLSELSSTVYEANQTTTNNSMSDLANSTSDFSFGSETERYILIVNLCAEIGVFFIGILGNGIVIAIILFFAKGNSVADVYIFNLAIADITFLLGLGFLFVTSVNDHWLFGNIMCKIFMSLTALNQFASSLLLSLMSFDRYLAVCHPIFSQRYRHPRPAKLICLVLWILCFVLMIPIFIHARTDENNQTCGIFWPDSGIHERVFTLYSFCLGFLLPLVLIVVFYRCVVVKLKSAAANPMSMNSERMTRNKRETNKRVSNLVKAIVATYGICWLPYWIGQMLIGFSESKNQMLYYTFNQVAACMTYLNSALNPILYAFLSDSFRRRCSQVWQSLTSFQPFKRRRRRTRHSQPPTTIQTSVAAENHHHHNHDQQQQPHSHPRHSQHLENNSTYVAAAGNGDGDDHDHDDEENNNIDNTHNKRSRDALSAGAEPPDLEEGDQRRRAGSLKSAQLPAAAAASKVIAGCSPDSGENTTTTRGQTKANLLSFRRLKFKRRKKKHHSLVKLKHVDCAANGNGRSGGAGDAAGLTVLLA